MHLPINKIFLLFNCRIVYNLLSSRQGFEMLDIGL